jgi:shikimate kinase
MQLPGPEPERFVVIIGPMGSGKSTLGRGLAEATGRRLDDSDETINARTGRTSREIATVDGVSVLHSLEKEVFFEALDSSEVSVVAAAASVIDDPAVRTALGKAFCVLVTASEEILDERLPSGSHRRVLQPDETQHIAGRERLYRECADMVIDTGSVSEQDAVDLVVAASGVKTLG